MKMSTMLSSVLGRLNLPELWGAIITPHNSGKFSLPKTLDNIVDIFIHNLKRYAEGLPLDNQVNRTTLYAADQNGGRRLLSTL